MKNSTQTKQRTIVLVAGALMLVLAASLAEAAVAEGADQKPVRVSAGGAPPSVNIPALRKRRDPPAAAAAAAAKSPTGAASDTSATGPAMIGEKEFNSCKKFPSGKRIVKLNLKPDTELGDLISWISSITCKQFLLPGTIPANSKKVTIVAPELITPEEAYRLFLGALDSVGLTVQPSGKVLRIIETVKAKSAPIPLYGEDSDVPMNESYVTRLIRVENADPNEVAQVLGRLKSEQGDVIVYAPQGALIVTDLASNIQRMMAILRQIDQPGTGEKVWIIGVKNTSAMDMAQKLGEIFQVAKLGGKGGQTTSAPPPAANAARPKPGDLTAEMMISKIIPDERSNQLIVIANEKSYARLLTLVKKLDVPIEGGDGRIHVYYCENANCDELAQTIGSVTGIAVSGVTGSRTRPRTSTPTPSPGGVGGPGQPLTGPNLLFEGEVRMNFDRPTNALIIVSSLKDYQALRRVIELLDSPRKQVFVEAMILEVTLDKERDLGASWHGIKPQNLFGLSEPSLIVGGLNPANTLQPTNALGDTMLAGILGPVLSPAEAQGLGTAATSTVDIPSFGVLIKALQTNSDVDVLSNPHLLIMNNEDGEISVGQKVPFPVSTLGLNPAGGGAAGALGGLGFGGLFPQVQRENVALEIKLTPHVNEHDVIRMEVDAKDSELAPGGSPTLGPSTSERSAKTVVVAKDQQTILIGGLMSDKIINSVTKVPLLGDIPILGFFFRTTTKHIVKTNLIIALTPYVINDQADLRRVLEKKMRERREFVERFGGEDRPSLEANIDYRRKRGMLEEINRAANEVEKEEATMERIRQQDLQDDSGPVELPVGPGSGSIGPAVPIGPPTGGGGPPPPSAPPAPPGPARVP
ncbi:MAG TPA: type II secretion system secretin GspD [Polyangia bacterium]|jgi:general secretion pathway protein D